jgi:hypothetical protein
MKTMKIKTTLTVITALILGACKNHTHINKVPTRPDDNTPTAISKNQTLPTLDTTIFISDLKEYSVSNKVLSEKEAQAQLYKYFAKKGVRTRNELKSTSNSKERLCIDYDTIYPIQTDRFSGAIISYWLGPADLNGHCFQPSKAVMFNTVKGYRISRQQFIPDNFAIDSVIKSNIYGYDYECGGRGIIRYFKVTLR